MDAEILRAPARDAGCGNVWCVDADGRRFPVHHGEQWRPGREEKRNPIGSGNLPGQDAQEGP